MKYYTLFTIVLILTGCKDIQKNKVKIDVYPDLINLEGVNGYSNEKINSIFDLTLKNINKSYNEYNIKLPDKLKTQIAICVVNKVVTNINANEQIYQKKFDDIFHDCFEELEVFDFINKKSNKKMNSRPNRDNYKGEVPSNLAHLVNYNSWDASNINVIYENFITNVQFKEEFHKIGIEDKFEDYCVCLTESIVLNEKPDFIKNKDKANELFEIYSKRCLLPFLDYNENGWGKGEIKFLKDELMSFIKWQKKTKSINISNEKLSNCIINKIIKKYEYDKFYISEDIAIKYILIEYKECENRFLEN